jgi:hypothetical protein
MSQTWTEASRLLARITQQGASLGNRDRRLLREACTHCDTMVRCLTGPTDDLAAVEVATVLVEVVQPIYSRPLLVEHLSRAQSYLSLLSQCEPGLEQVSLNPAQYAWLQEFLSDCCLMLLRDLATRQFRQHALAVGS